MEDYEQTISDVKSLERRAVGYKPYSGKIEIRKIIDISPGDFADLTYQDLLNLYERAAKVNVARQRLYQTTETKKIVSERKEEVNEADYDEKAEATKRTKKSEEVEEQMKAITTKALADAEELGKEMERKPMETEVPKSTAEKEIEFEVLDDLETKKDTKPEEEEQPSATLETTEEIIEPREKEILDVRKFQDLRTASERSSLEYKEEAEEKTEVAPPPKAAEEKATKALPPVLGMEEELVTKKLENMENKIKEALGGEADETALKKRMLQLTKELFKEKSVNKREEIKLEITVLKDMLAGKIGGKKSTVKSLGSKAAVEKAAKGQLLETLIGTQRTEISQSKDSMMSTYTTKIRTIKKKFYEKLHTISEDDEEERKQLYEKLVFELMKIAEDMSKISLKHQDAKLKKHKAEIIKLGESLEDKEKKLKERIDTIIEEMEDGYKRQFKGIEDIMKKEIDTIVELTGREVIKEKSGEKEKTDKTNVQEIVREVNDVDEATLLYYLHSKDQEYYRDYERKHVARGEAISKAKVLMAREKGLSDDMIRRYFSSEG